MSSVVCVPHGTDLQCNFQGTLEKKLAKGPLISNHLVFLFVCFVMEAVFFTYEQKHVSDSTFGCSSEEAPKALALCSLPLPLSFPERQVFETPAVGRSTGENFCL